ncbi:MAG: hypothetical protein AAF438_20705 [Pseudomonadota bacterium]
MKRETHELDVILVEDDDGHAVLFERACEHAHLPLEIRHVKDLRGMRTELQRKLPSVLVMDYLLPDGRSVDNVPNETRLYVLPTILITGFPDDRVKSEARKVGVRFLIKKSQAGFTQLAKLVYQEAVGQFKFGRICSQG